MKSSREKAEFLIVGAGLAGSSVAMHLAQMGAQNIVVIDVDLEGTLSSSELNAGGVRVTWNQPLNARLSIDSIDYFQSIAPEVGFLQKGYAWMYSAEHWQKARERLQGNPALAKQPIDYLSPAELSEKYAFLDKTADLGGATFSAKDGLINPNLLKNHYRAEAKKRGVRFLDRIWLSELETLSEDKVVLKGMDYSNKINLEGVQALLTDRPKESGESFEVECRFLVNACGPWAKRFQKILKKDSPCFSQRRQLSFFECREVDLQSYGMFVDSSGVYFHPEGGHIMSGFAIPSEPEGYNYHYDGEEFFNEHIWSHLYERSSKFTELKHITGWAGLYEVSPDHSVVLGTSEGLPQVFEMHSFSGRGVMQSYAAGRGLAELMMFKKYKSIDLTPFSPERFHLGKLMGENLLI